MSLNSVIAEIRGRLVRNHLIGLAVVTLFIVSFSILLFVVGSFIFISLGLTLAIVALSGSLFLMWRKALFTFPSSLDACKVIDSHFNTKDRALSFYYLEQEQGAQNGKQIHREIIEKQFNQTVTKLSLMHLDEVTPLELSRRKKLLLKFLPFIWVLLIFSGYFLYQRSLSFARNEANLVEALLTEHQDELPRSVVKKLENLAGELRSAEITDEKVREALKAAEDELDKALSGISAEEATSGDTEGESTDIESKGEEGENKSPSNQEKLNQLEQEKREQPPKNKETENREAKEEPTPDSQNKEPEQQEEKQQEKDKKEEEKSSDKDKNEKQKKEQQKQDGENKDNNTDVQHSKQSKGDKGDSKQQKQDQNGEKGDGQGSGGKSGGESQGEQGESGKADGEKGQGKGQDKQQGKQSGKQQGEQKGEKQGEKGQGSEKDGEQGQADQNQGLQAAQSTLDKIKDEMKKKEDQSKSGQSDQGQDKKEESGSGDKGDQGEQKGEGKGDKGDKGKTPNKGESQNKAKESGKQGDQSKKEEEGKSGKSGGDKKSQNDVKQKQGENEGKGGDSGKEKSKSPSTDQNRGAKDSGNEENEKSNEQKGDAPPVPRAGDEAKQYGDFEGGDKDGPGKKGFLDVKIPSKEEKFDTRFTSGQSERTVNNKDSQYRTARPNVSLGASEALKNKEDQNIPLEYRDLME